MDLSELKIKSKDFAGKDVASLPVHPSADGMSAEELQAAFDRSVKEVIAPKVNSLIDAVAAIQVGGVTPDGELLTSEKIVHSVAGTPTGGTVSDYLAQSMAHQSNYNNPHRVTKSTIGLSNVDNTSDANKPLSIAAKQAIDKLATKDEVALKADKSVLDGLGSGKKFANAVIGTRTAGWTERDCDYLCDGADDQVEVQKAIDMVGAGFGGGKSIHFLPGAYHISSAINVNKNLLTITGANHAYLYNPGKDGLIFRVTGHGCVFDGLSFGGDKEPKGNCTFIETGVAQLFISNMNMAGAFGWMDESYPGGVLLSLTGGGSEIAISNSHIEVRVDIRGAENIREDYAGPCIIGSRIYLANDISLPKRKVTLVGSELHGGGIMAAKDVDVIGSSIGGDVSVQRDALVVGSVIGGFLRAGRNVAVAGSRVQSDIAAGGKIKREGVINS